MVNNQTIDIIIPNFNKAKYLSQKAVLINGMEPIVNSYTLFKCSRGKNLVSKITYSAPISVATELLTLTLEL